MKAPEDACRQVGRWMRRSMEEQEEGRPARAREKAGEERENDREETAAPRALNLAGDWRRVGNRASERHSKMAGDEEDGRRHRLRHRFQVVRKLGQGTYGKVQLAVNRDNGQQVAIKTIKKSKIESDHDLVRIRREIQIMSSIQHPHIIHIHEVFENAEKIVLVMQYASGGEMYDYLAASRCLSEPEARRVFRQIASAIYYCHKNKICHRDLKLENILLDDRKNVKITDFGLSNMFEEGKRLKTFCGSPLYASPEIVKGTPYCGPEVDCWSLGVLLFTLVYGVMPFDGSNHRRLVRQISEGAYEEPPVKSGASDLIRRLLTVNPQDRATIRDVCNDPWINRGRYDQSLLQVAEDMSKLTPVRLDLLVALAPRDKSVTDAPASLQESSAASKSSAGVVTLSALPSYKDFAPLAGHASRADSPPGRVEEKSQGLEEGGLISPSSDPAATGQPATVPTEVATESLSLVSTSKSPAERSAAPQPSEMVEDVAIASDSSRNQILLDITEATPPALYELSSKKAEEMEMDISTPSENKEGSGSTPLPPSTEKTLIDDDTVEIVETSPSLIQPEEKGAVPEDEVVKTSVPEKEDAVQVDSDAMDSESLPVQKESEKSATIFPSDKEEKRERSPAGDKHSNFNDVGTIVTVNMPNETFSLPNIDTSLSTIHSQADAVSSSCTSEDALNSVNKVESANLPKEKTVSENDKVPKNEELTKRVIAKEAETQPLSKKSSEKKPFRKLGIKRKSKPSPGAKADDTSPNKSLKSESSEGANNSHGDILRGQVEREEIKMETEASENVEKVTRDRQDAGTSLKEEKEEEAGGENANSCNQKVNDENSKNDSQKESKIEANELCKEALIENYAASTNGNNSKRAQPLQSDNFKSTTSIVKKDLEGEQLDEVRNDNDQTGQEAANPFQSGPRNGQEKKSSQIKSKIPVKAKEPNPLKALDRRNSAENGAAPEPRSLKCLERKNSSDSDKDSRLPRLVDRRSSQDGGKNAKPPKMAEQKDPLSNGRDSGVSPSPNNAEKESQGKAPTPENDVSDKKRPEKSEAEDVSEKATPSDQPPAAKKVEEKKEEARFSKISLLRKKILLESKQAPPPKPQTPVRKPGKITIPKFLNPADDAAASTSSKVQPTQKDIIIPSRRVSDAKKEIEVKIEEGRRSSVVIVRRPSLAVERLRKRSAPSMTVPQSLHGDTLGKEGYDFSELEYLNEEQDDPNFMDETYLEREDNDNKREPFPDKGEGDNFEEKSKHEKESKEDECNSKNEGNILEPSDCCSENEPDNKCESESQKQGMVEEQRFDQNPEAPTEEKEDNIAGQCNTSHGCEGNGCHGDSLYEHSCDQTGAECPIGEDLIRKNSTQSNYATPPEYETGKEDGTEGNKPFEAREGENSIADEIHKWSSEISKSALSIKRLSPEGASEDIPFHAQAQSFDICESLSSNNAKSFPSATRKLEFSRDTSEAVNNDPEGELHEAEAESKLGEKKGQLDKSLADASTDRELSDDEFDLHFDDSQPIMYGSQSLWNFLKAINEDLTNHLKIIKMAAQKSTKYLRSLSTEHQSKQQQQTIPSSQWDDLADEDDADSVKSTPSFRHSGSREGRYSTMRPSRRPIWDENKWEEEFSKLSNPENLYPSLYATTRRSIRYSEKYRPSSRSPSRESVIDKVDQWRDSCAPGEENDLLKRSNASRRYSRYADDEAKPHFRSDRSRSLSCRRYYSDVESSPEDYFWTSNLKKRSPRSESRYRNDGRNFDRLSRFEKRKVYRENPGGYDSTHGNGKVEGAKEENHREMLPATEANSDNGTKSATAEAPPGMAEAFENDKDSLLEVLKTKGYQKVILQRLGPAHVRNIPSLDAPSEVPLNDLQNKKSLELDKVDLALAPGCNENGSLTKMMPSESFYPYASFRRRRSHDRGLLENGELNEARVAKSHMKLMETRRMLNNTLKSINNYGELFGEEDRVDLPSLDSSSQGQEINGVLSPHQGQNGDASDSQGQEDCNSHTKERDPAVEVAVPRGKESVSERIWRKSFYSRFNAEISGRRRRSLYKGESELWDSCLSLTDDDIAPRPRPWKSADMPYSDSGIASSSHRSLSRCSLQEEEDQTV